jgi:hypothetical protein
MPGAAPHVKRHDAIIWLRRIAQECAAGMTDYIPHFASEPTYV